jgi:5-methylcytosine-specific restriction endonuclease McrA
MTGRDARLTTPGYRKLRLAVLDRDRWACRIGGPGCTGAATEVDHIVARAAGGAVWDPRNLRAACAHCNRAGGAALANRRFVYRNGVADYVTRF